MDGGLLAGIDEPFAKEELIDLILRLRAEQSSLCFDLQT